MSASQEVFETTYRGRQSFLHHMAYMRMSKVLLTQSILEKAELSLEGKTIFDYGFGAGTFFRYCPQSAQLFGVEMDAVNVAAVQQMASTRGHQHIRLEAIDINQWEQHPLLQQQYDIVLCSHVLEHLAEPVKFLRRIKSCLNQGGSFVGLVPINERRANPYHVQTVDQLKIMGWMQESGLKLRCYTESDPWNYWIQPLFTYAGGRGHKVVHLIAQLISLGLGIPATSLGHRRWETLSTLFARLTFSKPSQAAFVAEKAD